MAQRALIGLLTLLPLLGCSGKPNARNSDDPADNNKQLVDVELALNWYPEAEHGGFIAADVLGYFEEEGLRVKIKPGGPGAPVIPNVATQRVQFAVANADQVLMGRDKEADVVAVMTAMQDSPRCIMVHRKSGITSFDQLSNMTLAVGSGKPFFLYLKTKVALKNIKLVNYSGSVAQFLQDEKYAQQGYVFSEPFVAQQQGGDPHCLMVSEIGFNPYTSLLITSGDLLRDKPELIQKVVRACKRGWTSYLKDPDLTNRKIHDMRKVQGMSLEALKFGAEALVPLCLPSRLPPEKLGSMTAERWQTLFQQLVEAKVLSSDSKALDNAFTTRFLEE